MKSIILVTLALAVALLSGCAKRMEGFYGRGGQGFLFVNDGTVSIKIRGMPNAGARGKYTVNGDRVSISLDNGTTHELKAEAGALVTIDAKAERYQLMSLESFMAVPEPEPRAKTPPKTF